MTDLDRLIAAVEAGWFAMDVLSPDHEGTAYGAFSGDLNAAHRLHDALLPGWDVDLELRPLGADIESGLSDVLIYAPYSDGGGIRGCDANPARAWLLAILRAVNAKDAAP